MSEWLSGNLGDIADIVMGQSPTGESVNTNGLGVPLLNGPTEFTIRYPKAVQFSTDPKRFSKVNDILFCVRGSTTGRMNWADEDYAIGRGLAAIRHKQGEEYRYFVKAILDYYLDTMLASASGSTFPNVSKDQLNELEISYPSFPEQKAIASVLSSLDDKIDLLHRQNKTLEAMAETLFRQWFIEEAKEDWEEKTLEHVISHFIDYRGKTPNKTTSGIPLITAKIVKDGRIQAPTEFISEEDYPLWMTRGYPEINDVVLTTEAPLGEIGLIRDTKVALAQRIITLRCDPEQFDNVLLKYYLMSEVGQYELDSRASGTTVFGIKASVLKKLSLAIPPLEEQREIAQRLHTIEDKMYANEQQARILAQLRDTLLPKLMSGEVRVQVKQESAA
jgi:type I restriction enzyme S subunit